ncbi:MAG: adenylate/guanylate cyclase domain-containing protein [Ignavibacteria bacterium]|nr:adenylate/guanylate cyclase domain-containing protein [Ignavibacteria bacterium]
MNNHLKELRKLIESSSALSEQDVKHISEELANVEEDLQGKDRLLEIENALDEVRTVAMNMKKPEDMLDICRVICRVLEKLNVRDIRNIQTAIFYETKHIHTNYVYFRLADVSLLQDVDYSLQEDVAAFADKMLRGPSEFFTTSFDKAKINEYIKYQDEAGQFVDQYLENADSLNFYFYSFGTGALGLSTYSPLSEEDVVLFKRFRNVFELAYRRFADIEQAIEQAREAQIEVALERVRSRAMAMHSSEDLSSAISVFFQELKSLGVMPWRCGVAQIDEETRTTNLTTTSLKGEGDHAEVIGKLRQEGHPVLDKIFEHWKTQTDYFPVLRGKEIDEYYKVTRPQIAYPDYPVDTVQYGHMIFFKEGFVFAWTEKEMTEEELRIFRRFAGVLSLTYRRFLDLKEAEAQAHKAQIETALERVRARALAMQQPEELKEVEQVLRHEMGLLGVREIETCGIFIRAENTTKAECWYELSNPKDKEKRISDHFELDFNDTSTGREILGFLDSTEEHASLELNGTARKEWIEYFRSNSPSFKGYYGDEIPDITYHLQKFSHGALCVASFNEISEESRELLMRAANVFSLAYSRFKDLTKSRQDLQNLIEEKKRSESLLLNILPEEIALELKQFSRSYARYHDEVTILFADIKGFSGITENLSAEELVSQLDECFRAFDKIVDKHGLEKIKTVGDMYVCACGLPKPVNDNAVKTVRAALDMINFLKGFNAAKQIQDLPAFDFRVGIHTGPVITGVVGQKKFTYDIWGDAVNMAARMEQHGEPGKINISGSTYALVKDKFTCIHRGKIEAKNKGKVDMYFVEG